MSPAPPPPPPPAPRKPTPLPLLQLVNHLARALKATRFYAPNHAVVAALLDEVQKALQSMLVNGPFTLGAVGTTLLTTDGPLESASIREVAATVAGTLYQRGVAALRFEPGTSPEELGALISALAAAPDEVRARGGVAGQVLLSGVTNIKVVEVDLKALHAGEATRLDELAGDDPVALQALKRALQLETGKKAGGEALGVALAAGAGAAELGQYYDQLVRRAAAANRPAWARPQVAGAGLLRAPAGAPGAQRGPGQSTEGGGDAAGAHGEGDEAAPLAAEQLAQLATDAFDQVLRSPRAQSPAEAQAALQQLGHALGQLPADVRLKVLQKLSRADSDGPARPALAGQPVAAGLGKLLSDKLVGELLAAGLAEQGDPDELAALLQQLRPEPGSREALVAQAAQGAGPGAAQLVKRLQQSVLSGGALADRFVPLPYRESLQRLRAAAQFAKARSDQPGAGLGQLLGDATPVATSRFAAAAWVKLSRDPEGLGGLEKPAQELIEWLEDNQEFGTAVKLAFAVAEACERTRPPRRELIHKLFSGAAGVPRAERLLVDGAPARPWIATALEPLVFHGAKASVRAKLVQTLSAQGEAVLPRLRARFSDASPSALALALEIAANISAAKTLPLCRELLRQGTREAKSVAVKALARVSADPGAVALLATLSGAEGDKPSAAALRLEGQKTPAELRGLQREAALALGQSKCEGAVAPLLLALHRSALFGDKELEPIRLAAAGGLGDLYAAGIGGARSALERGARDAKGKARELCARALERKP